MWGGDAANYAASLTEGHWNVILSSDAFWGLQVRITVADDASFTSVIAESGTGTGNYPEVGFTLETAQTVYIRVEENSVYSDSSGFFDIGVYDDGTAFGVRIVSFFWNNILVLSFAIPLLFMCCCLALARRGRGPAAQPMWRRKSFTVDAPSFAIPEERRGASRSDGSEIRTVRVPRVCPNCGGALSQDNLDWTGPLEARCNYCGAVIQATLERI
ncbi:MAG: hypothetical protein EAX95_01950 [Candidatus Thorarchaeota archaeon]|nr:hypothetical protein [Candidatus Thorarchaeota archaeon]